MTHHTRPAHLFLKLNLVALALFLHVCVFAPQLRAWQDAMPTPVPPAQLPAGVPSSSGKLAAITKAQLLYALRSREHDEAALVRLVERRGSSFQPTAEDEKELRAAGATDRLLEAVRKAYTPPRVYGLGIGSGERIGVGPGRGVPVDPGGGGPGNSETVDYTRPFRHNEVTRKAMITFKPQPGFTDEARKNSVSGVVRLRAVLNFSGAVTNISVVKGLPDGLTEKAIAAARQIRFSPAQKDGRAVSQHVMLEYNFDSTFDEKGAAERSVTFEKPFDVSEVDERAIILEKPAAEYTEAARGNDVRGKVVLKVTLTHFGSVIVDSVEAGLPHGLTGEAVDAARRIVFEPARRGGRAVSQSATVEYLFAP